MSNFERLQKCFDPIVIYSLKELFTRLINFRLHFFPQHDDGDGGNDGGGHDGGGDDGGGGHDGGGDDDGDNADADSSGLGRESGGKIRRIISSIQSILSWTISTFWTLFWTCTSILWTILSQLALVPRDPSQRGQTLFDIWLPREQKWKRFWTAVGRIWILLTTKATTFYVENNGEAKAFIIGRWGQVCFHLKIMLKQESD